MYIAHTFQTIKTFIVQMFHTHETPHDKRTKKYTQQMIKKYGKTLRKLSKE